MAASYGLRLLNKTLCAVLVSALRKHFRKLKRMRTGVAKTTWRQEKERPTCMASNETRRPKLAAFWSHSLRLWRNCHLGGRKWLAHRFVSEAQQLPSALSVLLAQRRGSLQHIRLHSSECWALPACSHEHTGCWKASCSTRRVDNES